MGKIPNTDTVDANSKFSRKLKLSAFFRGTYEHALDSKGRVAVPKKFREGLLGTETDFIGEKLIVCYGLSKQLFVFSTQGFENLSHGYAQLPGEDADLLDRFFGASAMECQLDAQGRILIAPVLKAFAALEKDVVWVGQRGRVELWASNRWNDALDAVQQGVFLSSAENLKKAYSKIQFGS